MRNAFTLIIIISLAGCAVSSTIERAGSSKSSFDGAVYGGKRGVINPEISGVPSYRIFHQGATGFTSVESVRRSALERATSFCAESENKIYLIDESTSTPPHILGNWPRVEIVFSCIDKPQVAMSKEGFVLMPSGKSKAQQIDELQNEKLSYTEYMRRFREINAQP